MSVEALRTDPHVQQISHAGSRSWTPHAALGSLALGRRLCWCSPGVCLGRQVSSAYSWMAALRPFAIRRSSSLPSFADWLIAPHKRTSAAHGVTQRGRRLGRASHPCLVPLNDVPDTTTGASFPERGTTFVPFALCKCRDAVAPVGGRASSSPLGFDHFFGRLRFLPFPAPFPWWTGSGGPPGCPCLTALLLTK